MSRLLIGLYSVLIGMFAIVPLVHVTCGEVIPGMTPQVIAALNLVGWSVAVAVLFARADLRRGLLSVVSIFGIEPGFRSMEALFAALVREVRRKYESLSINLVESKISSKRELSETLERIVGLAHRLLDADSAELALFDNESGQYVSSLVIGKPFRVDPQTMLAEVAHKDSEMSPEILIHPISFAGSVLGVLRVALRKGQLPTAGDQEILRTLAFQGGLAIINAEFTTELMRIKRAGEESVKAKTGFLANLSHEIRGPLGIMLNANELVLDGLCGPVTVDQTDTLKMIRSNGAHLLELINDVLDYAKIESGRITPTKVPILANELLTDISNVVRSQAETKHHRLIMRQSADPVAFSCDRRHARQMLINMLTNAIKYTPDSGTIEVWAERSPGNKVRICVRDSGVGIDVTERHKVFAAFERVDNSYSLAQVGTGLGMPLTKRLAEINGGMIDFESKPGVGSTFWLVFQAVAAETPALDTAAASEIPIVGKGEGILIVQREDGERTMIARYLAHLGFRVATAAVQTEAVEMLKTRTVDLVLVDNDMVEHGEKGEAALVAPLRESARANKLPIVLISSRAFVFDIEAYLRAGFDRCLSKPIELKELAKICREMLDNRSSGLVAVGARRPGSGTGDIIH